MSGAGRQLSLTGDEKRIAVIGVSGAGKSTLAAKIGEILDLPVVHLDQHYWKPGWIETPDDEWARIVDELASRTRWVIDGHYAGTLPPRLARADGVVFLDLPTRTCLRRMFGRWWRYRGRSRPDMSDGCPEHPNLEMVHWVLSFRLGRRPAVMRMLDEMPADTTRVRLVSGREVDEFVRLLQLHQEPTAGRSGD